MTSRGAIVVLLCVLLSAARADNSVHILSKYSHQLITSSTLNWIPHTHYDSNKDFVIGAFVKYEQAEDGTYNNQADRVESTKGVVFVCRALHTGIWVTGWNIKGEKRCVVSLLGYVKAYERFELLENVDSAARVGWVGWDKYHQVPVGAVATEKMYVARHVVPDSEGDESTSNFTHYVGTFNPTDRLGTITYVKDNDREESAESGEVLVETEPTHYELTSVKLNFAKKRIFKRIPLVLGEAVLSNPNDKPVKVAEAFGYAYNYTLYWGQGHAILKGLNTSVTLINKTRLPDIVWGIEEKENRTSVHTVEVILEPGTAVNVTLRANYTDMEVPYTGKIVSHYEDGTGMSRPISGIRREETMFDVHPEIGPIYFLQNQSLVPTTEPPTTTTEPTTTTVIAALGAVHDIFHGQEDEKQTVEEIDEETRNPDENMIIPPKKSDTTNMQSDDGGPLSLKDKVEGPSSAAGGFGRCDFVLGSLLVMALTRIT
ncbi:protein unzipped isoform X2 [Orussus abietinus]|nr:protein unzipped isoform X2 [Orussus abietinus]XP_012287162.1 protein unzipped isoform X2 [Orussus abietinus]